MLLDILHFIGTVLENKKRTGRAETGNAGRRKTDSWCVGDSTLTERHVNESDGKIWK